jgi:hypothetical protein
MEESKYPIKKEWEEHYKTLEGIRRCGVVNMWGAAPVLRECYPDLSEEQAKDILLSWIANYNELNEHFGWQK